MRKAKAGTLPVGLLSTMPEQNRRELLKSVLQRAAADERLADIALDLNVPRSTLNAALLQYAQDEWRDIQAARAITALEQADEGLERAQDPLALGRAREQLKSAQWKLERLCRRLFGTDTPQVHHGTVQINIGTLRPQVIDIEGIQQSSSDSEPE